MKTILISGKAGSGKTTTSKALIDRLTAMGYEAIYFRFAQPIYDMQDAVLAVLKDKYGLDRGVKDRVLLQILGTEYGRNNLGEDIWVKLAKGFIMKHGANSPTPIEKLVYVCDDLRFYNEAMAFTSETGTSMIRLEADRAVRMARADKFPENEDHPSETGLDNWGSTHGWNLVVHTDGEGSIENVVDAIIQEVGL